ncbi:MAG: hypothetical protein H0U18_18080 [Pyrinomonadaceae bacterium]|nr:hypothetical protein [Pyrinomonadaceae bacterium]
MRVFSAPERSEEGKEQILVAVGDEALLAKLDRYKEITAKLADPRRITEADAQKLIGEGKAFYWASGSIHSPETGSTTIAKPTRRKMRPHLSTGRFYETFGNGGADTMERTVNQQAQRDWFRPNPPLARVKWSLRNNINMQQSGILLAMNFVANNKDRFLQNFYLKSKRAVAKARNEGPAAYVIPADQSRLVEAADMVNLLRLMGVEVHTANKEINIKDHKFPAGSYVVRMDQPYSRMADMMMDTQYYNVNDPRPYDDTGWTLGALRNVKTVRVTDMVVLEAPANLLASDVRVRGRLVSPIRPLVTSLTTTLRIPLRRCVSD